MVKTPMNPVEMMPDTGENLPPWLKKGTKKAKPAPKKAKKGGKSSKKAPKKGKKGK